MKKEEQLHQLIQALTAAEKKYLRININKFHPEEDNKNNLLFDTLNKQKKYHPNQTEEAYQQANYTSDFLAADRHQLYDIILDSLTDFHRQSTAEVQISIGYQKAVLLYEKKLFSQALKQIERVVKLALQFESYGTLISLSHLKQRILKTINDLDAALQAIEEEHAFWIAQSNINQYIALHYESVKLRIELAKARSSKNLERLDLFIKNPLLQQDVSTLGFQIQFHYWETYCNYYFIQDDKQQELAANLALVQLIDNFPHFKKNEPLNYLVFRTRILAIQRNLFPEEFPEKLKEYRTLNKTFSKQQQQAESHIFIFSYNFELDYYIHHQQWNKALEIIPSMLQGLKKHDTFIADSLKITAFYRIANLYFFQQQFLESLDALDKVLDDYPATLRPDVYSFALLLKIIIHFELGNLRLMPYLIKTAQYHISKRNRLFQTEKIALAFLKKLSKKNSKKEQDELFYNFELAIQEVVQNNEYENRSLEIFNFITWINGKKASKQTKIGSLFSPLKVNNKITNH